MTNSSDFSPDELAEEMTENVVHAVSRLFGQDFTNEIEDSDLESAHEKVEAFLTEVQSLEQSNPDEEDVAQFFFEKYNEVAAQALELDESQLDSLDGFKMVLEEIDSALDRYRNEGQTFGYPEYFDVVEMVSNDLLDQEDREGYLKTITEGWEDVGEKKEQRMFARYDCDLRFIIENPEVEDSSIVDEYLNMYVGYCEQFKSLSPFLIYAVNAIEIESGNLDDRLNDPLGNLLCMCSSRARIDVFAEAFDNGLRNAITHDDYLIDPIDETVEMNVNGEDEVFSYSEVRDLTVEARCAAQSLFIFPVLLDHKENLRELTELREELGN